MANPSLRFKTLLLTLPASGVEPIEGGCPLMYCQPVDPGHRFFRWWLRLRHRIPG